MAEAIKVLLIDDDEDEQLLTQDLLDEVSSSDYQLEWCNNYNQGVEKVLAGQHDIFLIDYHLGQNTGIDLLAEVKKSKLERASIMLTGQGDTDVDNAALEMGASDYLIKGEFEAHELDRAIRYSIEKTRRRDSLRFQAEILQNVHDAVFYVNQDGLIREWNEGASRIFEVPPEAALGQTIFDICPHENGHPFNDKLIPLVEKNGSAEEVLQCQLQSGEEIIIRAKVTALPHGDEKGYIVCASDITTQKKLEVEILRVTENEQRRIGQDIHDDLCSQLSGIGMMAKALERQMNTDREQEARMMADISNMIADAGQKARSLAKGLLPAALDTQGLPMAILEMAEQSEKLFGVKCDVTVLGEQQLESIEAGVAVQLFRIAQEATTNAMKHSDSELIRISLIADEGYAKLEISDDGKGMHDELVSSGLGMSTMRQRAEMINAEFELHSRLGKGTQILCRVKL